MGRNVAVLVATGSSVSGLAAKAATPSIPIVFISGTDPVQEGLVVSLKRPGGNATGVNVLLSAMESKRIGLLREMVPTAGLFGALLNPGLTTVNSQINDIEAAARSIGKRVHILRAGSEVEIDSAFATAVQLQVGGLLVGADPFMFSWRERVVALAVRHAIPAIYECANTPPPAV